jgi:hypothetical protein
MRRIFTRTWVGLDQRSRHGFRLFDYFRYACLCRQQQSRNRCSILNGDADDFRRVDDTGFEKILEGLGQEPDRDFRVRCAND